MRHGIVFAVSVLLASVSSLAQSARTTVPFKLVDNRIFVDLKINGRGPFACIFDTGASQLISPQVAKQLGLHVANAGDTGGVGEQRVQVGQTHIDKADIGAAEVRDLDAVVMSLDDTPDVFGTQRVDAIFGEPFFERYAVAIDYDKKSVTFFNADSFTAPKGALAVPFTRTSNIPIVEGELDGVAGRFGVDTGARSSLVLYGPFVERNKLREKYAAKFEGITGWGIGGPVRSQIARAKMFRFGPASVRDIIIRLPLQKAGLLTGTHLDGLIGPDILREFRVTFDYAHKRIYLEPSAEYGRHDSYERLGAWFGQKGTEFVVLDTMGGGPAAEAGLKAGDVISAVNGRAASTLLLPDVREQMRTLAAGTEVVLEVRSAGKTRVVKVRLRELV